MIISSTMLPLFTTDMTSQEEKEQQSVSEQVDMIMEKSFEQFTALMTQDRNDDAISIGDEIREWMRDEIKDEILYYNQKELRQQYRELVKQRKENS